jgi:hypothetical protein
MTDDRRGSTEDMTPVEIERQLAALEEDAEHEQRVKVAIARTGCTRQERCSPLMSQPWAHDPRCPASWTADGDREGVDHDA